MSYLLKTLPILILNLLQLGDSWIFNEINSKIINQIENTIKMLNNDSIEERCAPRKFSLIYPGTKWCGAGNVADNYDDLGEKVETDKCCRAHDSCSDVIPGGETKYNLTNTAFYSRLSCKCDEVFRQCLLKDGNATSTSIGIIYFDIIGTQCFRKDYNATGCKVYSGLLNKKCVEYDYDKTSQKFYQWFDVPQY